MLKLTEAAANQVAVASQQGGAEGMALRLAGKMQEDGSISYLMGFDNATEADTHVESHGIEIIIAPEYRHLLEEAVMDYVEMAPGDFRFIFMNPNDETYIPPTDSP